MGLRWGPEGVKHMISYLGQFAWDKMTSRVHDIAKIIAEQFEKSVLKWNEASFWT